MSNEEIGVLRVNNQQHPDSGLRLFLVSDNYNRKSDVVNVRNRRKDREEKISHLIFQLPVQQY